jgi:hypothetical protein
MMVGSKTCYRFHPVTGEDANDFAGAGLTDEQKQGLAEMFRNGAQYYWHQMTDGAEWTKLERSNYQFIANVIDEDVEWIDARDPAGYG